MELIINHLKVQDKKEEKVILKFQLCFNSCCSEVTEREREDDKVCMDVIGFKSTCGSCSSLCLWNIGSKSSSSSSQFVSSLRSEQNQQPH